MDPDANLAMVRSLIEQINEAADNNAYRTLGDLAVDLAEYVAALDGWISMGGFLPKAWERD
jgi:hypothetical protein